MAASSRETLLRGIASSPTTLYIGTGTGDLLLFSLTPKKITLLTRLDQAMTEGITCLSWAHDMLVSGDDVGNVALWNTKGEEVKRITEFRGEGYA